MSKQNSNFIITGDSPRILPASILLCEKCLWHFGPARNQVYIGFNVFENKISCFHLEFRVLTANFSLADLEENLTLYV